MSADAVRDTLDIDVLSMGHVDAALMRFLPCLAFLGAMIDIRRNDRDNLRVQVWFENGGMNRRTHLHGFRRLLMLFQRGAIVGRTLEDL